MYVLAHGVLVGVCVCKSVCEWRGVCVYGCICGCACMCAVVCVYIHVCEWERLLGLNTEELPGTDYFYPTN